MTTRLEHRITILEREMEWSKSNINKIYSELSEIRKDVKDLHNRIADNQARTDAQFVAVHKELSGIHQSMTTQTRWMLAGFLGTATMISIGMPLMRALVDLYVK